MLFWTPILYLVTWKVTVESNAFRHIPSETKAVVDTQKLLTPPPKIQPVAVITSLPHN